MSKNSVCIQCGAPIYGPPALPCAAYPVFARRHKLRGAVDGEFRIFLCFVFCAAAYPVALLMATGCGRVATMNPSDDAGDAMGHEEAGPVVSADAAATAAGNLHDGGFQDAADADDPPSPDAGNPDAGTCAPDECDCTWLATNCSFYTPPFPCGVSAACAQAFDVDPNACTRTVHTATTDAGACALHDDGVTWCCP